MERKIAQRLYDCINLAVNRKLTNYKVAEVPYTGTSIYGFHEWVDGNDLIGALKIQSWANKCYYLFFIEWQPGRGNYYLTIYPENKSGPIVEIHRTEKVLESLCLCWDYSPRKQDGRNDQRKSYFGSTKVRITVPETEETVDEFIDDIFSLCQTRLKADNLNSLHLDYREAFPEGRAVERLHRLRERNQGLISLVKRQALEKTGKLACMVCGFNFNEKYGELGEGFIEAHHTLPLSRLQADSVTRIEDIVLVCSNCHSIIHRKRPWLSLMELKKIIR